MAQQVSLGREKLSCSICLDILKDPVTIPCGHNYCMSCIKDCWGKENEEKTYSCPQCRQSFKPRPALVKNTMLAELVEELKKTGLQDASPDLSIAKPGDVVCDYCYGVKLKVTEEWENISLAVTGVDVLMTQAEPRTRAEFRTYSRQITLDPNTAQRQLSLSDGNRKATLMKVDQSYSAHPDRLVELRQVLSTEGLTGRCYWEVEWSGKALIAVAYKDINRTGTLNECVFGNNKSWALVCNIGGTYTFYHRHISTSVSGPPSSRIGVYLDHRAGSLSFYSVSDTMTLLHREQTTFTQPLYPGFRLWQGPGDSAELCELK